MVPAPFIVAVDANALFPTTGNYTLNVKTTIRSADAPAPPSEPPPPVAADTPDEQAIFGEPGEPTSSVWQHNLVNALFDSDADVAGVLQACCNELGIAPPPEHKIATLEENDWVRITQSQFDPIRISDRLWIVPTWHEPTDPKAINIALDPGLAFGTGSHPTTRLCLRWLDNNIKGGESVLDYGCGSGILAIAALKLGAARAVGVDVDSQAVVASRDNAIANHVENVQFFMPNYAPKDTYDVYLRVDQRILDPTLRPRRALERAQLAELRAPDPRRLEWLAARTAAKEAVQALVREHAGRELAATDVEIVNDANGRPIVRGAALDALVPVGRELHMKFVNLAHGLFKIIDQEVVVDRPEEGVLDFSVRAGDLVLPGDSVPALEHLEVHRERVDILVAQAVHVSADLLEHLGDAVRSTLLARCAGIGDRGRARSCWPPRRRSPSATAVSFAGYSTGTTGAATSAAWAGDSHRNTQVGPEPETSPRRAPQASPWATRSRRSGRRSIIAW